MAVLGFLGTEAHLGRSVSETILIQPPEVERRRQAEHQRETGMMPLQRRQCLSPTPT